MCLRIYDPYNCLLGILGYETGYVYLALGKRFR